MEQFDHELYRNIQIYSIEPMIVKLISTFFRGIVKVLFFQIIKICSSKFLESCVKLFSELKNFFPWSQLLDCTKQNDLKQTSKYPRILLSFF